MHWATLLPRSWQRRPTFQLRLVPPVRFEASPVVAAGLMQNEPFQRWPAKEQAAEESPGGCVKGRRGG